MGTPLLSGLNDPIRTFRSELVCLDLQQGQGKLLWRLDARDLPGQEGVNSFEGTPVAASGRLYVAWRSSQPQTELHVACLTAADGSLVWSRRVCALAAETMRGRKVAGHHLLTVAAGRVYCGTDSGAIATLSAENGALQWARTYPRSAATVTREHSRRMAGGLTPCLYANERVYAAPADSDSLLCLDAATGRLLWEQTIRGGVAHLLGTIDGRLVVAGHRLWAMDCQTGQVAWHAGFDDLDAGSYGRGVIAGNLVYWPLRDEILLVNATTGRLERRLALAAAHGEEGGNLTIADGHLLIAGPQKLTAFSEYGQLRTRIRDAISRAPDNARNWLRLGLLENARNNSQQAAVAFQQAIRTSDSSDSWRGQPTIATARCWRAHSLLTLARELQHRGDLATATTHTRTAASLALLPALAAEGWLLAAELEHAQQHPSAALTAWREVLVLRETQRQAAARPAAHSSRTRQHLPPAVHPLAEAARQARTKIAAVLRNLSPTERTHHERHVDEQIRLALQHETPLPALVRLARISPDEPALHRAVQQRAGFHPDPVERTRAAMLARELALPAEATSPAAADTIPVADSAFAHTLLLPDTETESIPLVEEVWRLPLPPDATVSVPDCPPGSHRTGLLIDEAGELRWVSLADGSRTFRLPENLRPQWSCEVNSHLLVQTASAKLAALHTHTGRLLWLVDPHPKRPGNAHKGDFPGQPSNSLPLLWHPPGTALLISATDNGITGRSVVDGVPLWQMHIGERHPLAPLPGDSPGTLLTSDRGPHLWLSNITADSPAPVLLPEPPDSVLAFAANLEPTAVLLSSMGVLTAFRRAGQATARVLWRTAIADSSSTPPLLRIEGPYLLLTMDSRRLHCFAMEDGEHCWSCGVGHPGKNLPAVRVDSRHRRVLVSEGTSLVCRNLADGTVLWRRRPTGSPRVVQLSANVALVISTTASDNPAVQLELFAADSGEPVQRKPLPGLQGNIACHHMGNTAARRSGASSATIGGLLIADNGISRFRLTTARAHALGAQQK